MYDLLVEAVAGVAEISMWPDESRYSFTVNDEKYRWTTTYCNIVNRIAVSFPGGNHMDVSFKSSSDGLSIDCWKVRETAGHYLGELMPRVETLVGDGDLYVDHECVP
jgi:hypothetical protein